MPPMTSLRYRLGFLGAWTLFVIALAIAGLAVAAEIATWRDAARLARMEKIDHWIGRRYAGAVVSLRGAALEQSGRIGKLRSDIEEATVDLDEPSAAVQTILVSTAENRLWVRTGG